ncbi:MAG: HAMP domain-containing histidine kinase [Eubacterium sp.]|nr:HAMP domain-containing histidine kinase [Eubacterium sp.]
MRELKGSFIYSKKVKAAVYLLGFLFFVGMIIAVISAYGRFHFFGKDIDRSKPFQEIAYTESIVNSCGENFVDYIDMYGRLKNLDFNNMSMNLRYYPDIEEKHIYTAKDLEQEEKKSLIDIAEAVFLDFNYVDSNGVHHDIFSEHPYTFYDFMDINKNFICISGKDYVDLIKSNADRVENLETAIGNFRPGIYANEYVAYYDEDGRLKGISSNSQSDIETNFDVKDQDMAVAYVTVSDSSPNSGIALYSEEENLFFNGSVGMVDLETLMNTKYLYIPACKVDGTDLNKSLISAPYFDYAVAPFLASQSFENISMFESFVYDANNLSGINYGFIDRETGRIVSRGEIYGSFDELRHSIINESDIVVEFSASKNRVNSFYYDKKGEFVKYNYCKDTLMKKIDKMPEKVDFIFGIKLDDETNELVIPAAVYTYCRVITQPVPVFIILAFFFTLTVIFLTMTTGVVFDEMGEKDIKLGFSDRIPAEVYIGTFLALLYIAYRFIRTGFKPYGFLVHPSGTIDYDNPATVIAVLLIILLIYIFVSFVFLSFVRRVRKGVFFKELIVFKLYDLLYKGYKNVTKNFSARMLFFVKLFIFSGANIFLIYLLFKHIKYEEIGIIDYFFIIGIIILDFIGIFKLVKYTNQIEKLIDVCKDIENGKFLAKVNTDDLSGSCRKLGESLNHLGEGLNKAVEASTKDEKLKAELITNVSHDIKTPLTSIINYVDLMKREKINNPKLEEYINILDVKSQRLKQLTLDLIEASKVSTGNIEFEYINLDYTELIQQAVAEFEDKFTENSLEIVLTVPDAPAFIHVDGARTFRIIENLFTNASKYAIQGSRVYMNLSIDGDNAAFSIKNVSREMLNISAEELTERFVRGDKSRFTEGSGLGLSIARNLTELQGGVFNLSIDGDLFKVDVIFPIVPMELITEQIEEETEEYSEESEAETDAKDVV